MSIDAEANWMERATAAFREIHAEYRRGVESLLAARGARGSWHGDAEDLVQDVFISLWKMIERRKLDWFVPERWREEQLHLRRLLYQIAEFRRRKQFRRRTREVPAGDAEFAAAEGSPEAGEPPEILKVIDGLPAEDREVLRLLADGFCRPDMEQMLGLSPTALRMRIHRARIRLRELLARLQSRDCA